MNELEAEQESSGIKTITCSILDAELAIDRSRDTAGILTECRRTWLKSKGVTNKRKI